MNCSATIRGAGAVPAEALGRMRIGCRPTRGSLQTSAYQALPGDPKFRQDAVLFIDRAHNLRYFPREDVGICGFESAQYSGQSTQEMTPRSLHCSIPSNPSPFGRRLRSEKGLASRPTWPRRRRVWMPSVRHRHTQIPPRLPFLNCPAHLAHISPDASRARKALKAPILRRNWP